MNSTNETLLFDCFLIMYNLCVFTCIVVMFVFHCTHVRMSYVLNSYLLTYLLTYVDIGRDIGTQCILQATPVFQRVPSRDEPFQQGVINMKMTPLQPE